MPYSQASLSVLTSKNTADTCKAGFRPFIIVAGLNNAPAEMPAPADKHYIREVRYWGGPWILRQNYV